MMKTNFISLFLSLVMLYFFNPLFALEKLSDGVIIKFEKVSKNSPQLIKIQVCDNNIFRVIATPGNSFSERKSLMVAKDKWDKTPFTLNEENGNVIISTVSGRVEVNQTNGAVSFYRKDGTLLLNEIASGGKIITPAEVMGEDTYHIQNIFHSPDDEAFFGLGAHQNDIWNYKGQDVDLWQYNIINAIPFLVSSKKYGILWDNNSRTKFGDIRDYQSISHLKLYDNEGNRGGLTAEYFKDIRFDNLYISRTEKRIEHEFIDVNDDYPEGFSKNVSAVRWSGEIASDETGFHKFRLYCSGYTKMWLNGELVVDSWRQNWLPWTHLPRLYMKAGNRYAIKIEWIHSGGFIGLKYLNPEDKIYTNRLSLYSEVADQIDFYLVIGNNMDEVIKGYRKITGKAPMMPKWAMGLWQCRERYKTQEELLSVVKEFRKRQIPLDNIVQDWFYWEEDKWGSHEFDADRYPDPMGMVKELHQKLNTHVMISVWPKFYVGTKNYNLFEQNGWLYMRNVEKEQRDWVGPGYVSTFYDAYNEQAGKLYWKLIDEKLFTLGFDAWWLDATEPDIQSNMSREETKRLIGPTALGTSARYLNAYSLMNSKSVYTGQRQADPNKRVFILTRSAFPGQQRYATATWSGDIAARWYDLKAQISAGLNFSLSGIPYWTTDIGGFAVEHRYENPGEEDLEEWRELNARWFQFGTFCPLFRVHGQFPYREMFNIAPDNHPAYKTMLAYDKLHYRLMPYIYSLTGMVTHDAYTIMRALVMDFGQDKTVTNIGDQFMFGPNLMVNPVTDYLARKRTVYLPAGTAWYHFQTGQYFDGGQSIEADAPYEEIPLFVRAGAILPCGPAIQYTAEKTADPIRLIIYTGADGTFKLYEDEEVNYNYENGKYAIIDFSYNDEKGILTIGKREGSFPGMLETRIFEIVWLDQKSARSLDFSAKPDIIVTYNGNTIEVKRK